MTNRLSCWIKMVLITIMVILATLSPIFADERDGSGGKAVGMYSSLAQKKILFGHQSVGVNIMDGVKANIINSNTNNISIENVNGYKKIKKGTFVHMLLGENRKPFFKIQKFEELMVSGYGNNVDIAFFKFCYIDIDDGTDVVDLFNRYKYAMLKLRERYPKTKFVHVTVPLTQVQTGIKASIKKLIGKPIGGYADNRARNCFNELMIKYYSGREPIFDLAKVESTFSNGRRSTYRMGGKELYCLIPEYASDGRHLNDKGQKWVASALLKYLSEMN